jgi:hypothetical protein
MRSTALAKCPIKCKSIRSWTLDVGCWMLTCSRRPMGGAFWHRLRPPPPRLRRAKREGDPPRREGGTRCPQRVGKANAALPPKFDIEQRFPGNAQKVLRIQRLILASSSEKPIHLWLSARRWNALSSIKFRHFTVSLDCPRERVKPQRPEQLITLSLVCSSEQPESQIEYQIAYKI